MYKDIPGYGGLYQINHYGEVRRVYKGKVLKMSSAVSRKHLIIRLTSPEGKRRHERIHKLMQRTFFPPPKPGKVFYHKNGDRKDNWINNLGYICNKELGRKTGAKSKRKPVLKLDQDGEIIGTYSSARQAARENYMSYQTVITRCNGEIKGDAPDGFRYVWDADYEY